MSWIAHDVDPQEVGRCNTGDGSGECIICTLALKPRGDVTNRDTSDPKIGHECVSAKKHLKTI